MAKGILKKGKLVMVLSVPDWLCSKGRCNRSGKLCIGGFFPDVCSTYGTGRTCDRTSAIYIDA